MDHPLSRWRRAKKLDLEAVADLLAQTGKRPSPDYLSNIERGYDAPGWALCVRIASAMGKGASMAVKIKGWSASSRAVRAA